MEEDNTHHHRWCSIIPTSPHMSSAINTQQHGYASIVFNFVINSGSRGGDDLATEGLFMPSSDHVETVYFVIVIIIVQ